ncbi:MAG: hypothetical protein KC931_16640, partial [Candidatus Omnitrophica bacterium]|nr:hypothetical protein [Candidatus Omnitrophota bacterium]
LEVNPLIEGGWEVQHANNRIMGIHMFDEVNGIAIGWSGVQYETNDGGKTWSHRERGWTMVFFDWIGDEGWMVSSAGVGHTTNRGVDWENQPAPLTYTHEIDFRDSMHGWICGSGIAYTEDGGQTWHRADTPTGQFYETVEFADDLNGFAGGVDKVFVRSVDGGHTWNSASLPWPAKGRVIETRDQGKSFGRFPENGIDKEAPRPEIGVIYFLNDQEGWIGTNVADRLDTVLFYTDNGGASWTRRSIGGQGRIDLFQFLADGLRGWTGGLFSGDFYRTYDGGGKWESISLGPSTHILDLQFLDENVGWALPNVVGRYEGNTIVDMEGSIAKSVDGGKSFQFQYGWPVEDAYKSPGPQFLDVSFPDASHGWALGRHTWSGPMLPARVYFTDSGGADWRVLSELEFGVHSLHFTNELRGFALHQDAGVPPFETRDGGKTWFGRQDIRQVSPGGWGDIVFADDQYGWIVQNGHYDLNIGDRTLLRTTDGGNKWEVINKIQRGGYHSLYFLDRERGWMVNDYGFIESTTDSGETWTLQRSNLDGVMRLRSIYFVDEFSGWAVGDYGAVLSTTDGGTHWNAAESSPNHYYSGVYFNTCQKGWFAGEENADPVNNAIGNPVFLETKTASYEEANPVPIGLVNHNIRLVDSPDGVNVWALGDFGVGLKFAGPTDALQITTHSVPPGRVGESYSLSLERENG